MLDLVWLIPALPLAGFVIILVFGRRLGDPRAGYLAALRVAAGEPFWSSMEPSTPLAAFEATEEFLLELDARA